MPLHTGRGCPHPQQVEQARAFQTFPSSRSLRRAAAEDSRAPGAIQFPKSRSGNTSTTNPSARSFPDAPRTRPGPGDATSGRACDLPCPPCTRPDSSCRRFGGSFTRLDGSCSQLSQTNGQSDAPDSQFGRPCWRLNPSVIDPNRVARYRNQLDAERESMARCCFSLSASPRERAGVRC